MPEFEELITQIKIITYGRNSNRGDFSLVISENKGTCGSKHAFLKEFANQYVDVTTKDSDFENLRNDILEEIEIQPFQVVDFKVKYHQGFIKNWLIKDELSYSFEQIWQIREQCITNLSL